MQLFFQVALLNILLGWGLGRKFRKEKLEIGEWLMYLLFGVLGKYFKQF